MSILNIQIEDKLKAAGYKTDRVGDVVRVYDPVHRSVAGSSELIIDHYKLVEIRSTLAAWKFIEARK